MADTTAEESYKTLPPPWDRIFSLGTRLVVWVLLFAVLYILRPFFLLIFLTFVFAYIQAHGVDGLRHRLANRSLRVVLVALVFLGFLVAVGYFLGPRLADQAKNFADNAPKHLEELDNRVREIGLSMHVPVKALEGFRSEEALKDLLGFGTSSEGTEDPWKNTLTTIGGIGERLLAIGSAFLLSLLFSFLIVLDLPKLTRAVQGLRATKLGFIYEEVADNIRDFGRVLGTALEAQLFIAITNTILTSIGIYFMGLPGIVFLGTIVFFCSFIPVAGVFLSSTPICLVALQLSGVKLMLVAIGLILVIHFIEAYFLNPMIFGHHFRMNAVIVLIVLTVCGKLFGFWGLVLGLPVANYFFAHAIRYKRAHADPQGTSRVPPSEPRVA
jgi:predicted PurR-regulated permease PerM